MGWIGCNRSMMYALQVVGADRDEEGKFLIYGDPPWSFLGIDTEDNDVVVSDSTEYSVDGKRASLAGLLGSTSYGSRVHVVGGGNER